MAASTQRPAGGQGRPHRPMSRLPRKRSIRRNIDARLHETQSSLANQHMVAAEN